MPFKASARGAYGPQGQKVIKGPLAPVWVTFSPPASSGAYSYQFVATDDSGDAPTYSVASGTIPTGTTLSSSGLLSGTCTVASTFTFSIRATDVNGRFTDTGNLSIVVTLRSAATYTESQALALTSYVAGDVINFPYKGSQHQWNRYNATSVRITLVGGSGWDGDGGSRGGGGAYVRGVMSSFSQNTYYLHVGGGGGRGTTQAEGGAGGYNGGGYNRDTGNSGWVIAGGGGGTDFRTANSSAQDGTGLNSRLFVAGGGGSGSRNGGSGYGGPGGWSSGGSGSGGGGSGGAASGGTQSSGGSGGNGTGGFGFGHTYNSNGNFLGGVGGGWYGGGTGAYHMGNGGGGSSYYNTSVIGSFEHSTGSTNASGQNGSAQIEILTASA